VINGTVSSSPVSSKEKKREREKNGEGKEKGKGKGKVTTGDGAGDAGDAGGATGAGTSREGDWFPLQRRPFKRQSPLTSWTAK
jgi:hypothetical protein